MTRKSARKGRARARQEKTGQSYQSALRAEGQTIIRLKTDEDPPPEYEAIAVFNHGNSAIIVDDGCYQVCNRYYDRLADRTELFKPTLWIFPEALEVLRRLPPLGHRDRKPDNLPPPPLRGWGLFDETAISSLERRQSGETVRLNVEPQKLMDYWKPLPEAKRIIHAKDRLLGVTDDHAEKPLVTWTTLTATQECPGFGAWWHTLPQSDPYDRSGSMRVIVEEKHPMAGTTLHNRVILILPNYEKGEAMMDEIGRRVRECRPSWVGWVLVQTEPA